MLVLLSAKAMAYRFFRLLKWILKARCNMQIYLLKCQQKFRINYYDVYRTINI